MHGRSIVATVSRVVAFAALTLTACKPEGRTFAVQAGGSVSFDKTKIFSVDSDGHVTLGTCANAKEILSDSTIGRSEQDRQSLVNSGYCLATVAPLRDEQAFRVGKSAYGPEVEAFAAPYIEIPPSSSAFGGDYINIGKIIVHAPAGTQLPAEYTALQLVPGENCVFLKYFGKANKEWSAFVAPNPLGLDCIEMAKNAPANQADVPAFADGPSMSGKDYAPTIRFIESSSGGTLIGVKCGNRWCMIGANSPSALLPRLHPPANGSKYGTREEIKAWYDEQHLALLTPSGTIVPGPRASIEPVDRLEDIKDFSQKWIQVATVHLQDSASYAGPVRQSGSTGYDLHQGANPVWLHDTGGQHFEAYIGSIDPNVTTPQRKFRVTGGQGHPYVPGTARFKFSATDEKLWVACLMGCCLIEPD